MPVSDPLNLALNNGDWPRAKTLLTQLSRRAPKDPQVWFLLGAVNGALGDPNGVVKATRKSLELKPDQPEALFNLANALHELGRSGEAMNPLRRLLAAQPWHARARVLMGNAQDELGESMAAIASFSAAIEIAPELVEAHANLAKVLAALGEFTSARQAYANALRLRPNDDTVLYALVLLLARDGDTDAIRELLTHTRLSPGTVGEAVLRSVLLDKQGETEAAWQALRPFVEREASSLALSLQYATVCHHGDDCARATARLRAELARPRLPRDQAMHIEHALAKVLDGLGEHRQAFEHIGRFNAMQYAALPEVQRYRPRPFERWIDRLIEAFPAGTPRPGVDAAFRPVFIVGMPRSGTSLIEQMLASHPAVLAGGERMDIPDLVGRLVAPGPKGRYPDMFVEADADRRGAMLAESGDAYRAGVDARRGDAGWTTDKLPQNFLHLGLLAEMLPEARFIHCRRSPLDTCVSIHMQGFSAAHAYAFRLPTLAHYYQQYERLMAHWRRCPQIAMHEIAYEDMVADPEAHLRAMAAFLDLPWDPAMLEFHRNRRVVNTASYDQVRRPLYSGSIGRWRRYGDALRPLIEILGER